MKATYEKAVVHTHYSTSWGRVYVSYPSGMEQEDRATFLEEASRMERALSERDREQDPPEIGQEKCGLVGEISPKPLNQE